MGLSAIFLSEADSYTASIAQPQSGSPILAADVATIAQQLANRAKNLNIHKADYVVPSGKTQEFQGGSLLKVDAGATLDTSGAGAAVLHPAIYRPADAATINYDWAASGDTIVLPSPGAFHTCKVLDATATRVPQAGQRVIVSLVPGTGDGLSWAVKRESGTTICTLGTDDLTVAGSGFLTVDWSGGSVPTWPSWVELQYDGTNWRGVCFGGFITVGTGW